MSDETFREARTLLNERDPDKVGRGTSLASIKDATWVHQRYAMAHGYSSILELAVDELAAKIAELEQRIDQLEARLAGGQ